MTKQVRSGLWLATFLLLCLSTTMIAGWKMHHWGNGLSPVDSGSEANALREVAGFRAQGLWHDVGLGNVMFGPLYPHAGFVTNDPADRAHMVTPSGVYTHYPPGPEYLIYITQAILGPEPVVLLRLVPLTFCAGAAVFFGLSVRRRYGATVGWLVMLGFAAVVPFHDANSSVHYLGYALALLLIAISLVLRGSNTRLPFLLLGFAQGWLSFDYAFLVVLTPLATELALPCITPGDNLRLRLAIERSILAGIGFVSAHLLHFCQVWIYYGSFVEAFDDISRSARYRAGVDQQRGLIQFVSGGLGWINYFLVSPYPVNIPGVNAAPPPFSWQAFRFLGVTLGIWWLAAAIVLGAVDVWRRIGDRRPRRYLLRWVAVGFIGIGVSSGWWVVMQAHTSLHVHLFYRHLSVCFLLWAIFLAVQAAPMIDQLLARSMSDVGPGATPARTGQS